MSQERLKDRASSPIHTFNKDEDSPVLKALERHFEKYGNNNGAVGTGNVESLQAISDVEEGKG